ncbi:hypothetical protein BXO88_09015 [Oribacterium sp. C9]|uniref:hypothetical protein n=1 Tax=Oribacterium sp. C9 TaxID=1943579 RepID=UPI0009902357|nr:hypothetical protein [Oribacterium sp. C9]OON86176.1 hypothetical protein BXO88_09015 [Oribacterium sp. C9]
MSSLKEINHKVCIDDEILIDFQKPILNHSRLPLYQSGFDLKSLFGTLTALIHDSEYMDKFGDQHIYKQYYILIYFLFSKYMIRIPGTRATRTVELGADNCILSYDLCSLLEAFHTENEYYLVTDAKVSNHITLLKNLINAEKALKNLNLVNSDYDELNLPSKSFDFVILNGSTMSDSPDSMVPAAINLVKDHGIILVFNQFYNTVFDDVYAFKCDKTIHRFRSYMLDDEVAEVIVIET